MADLKKLGDEIRTLLRQLNGRQKATLLAFSAVILLPLLWLSVRSGDESWLAVQDGIRYEVDVLRRAEQALRESGLNDLRVDGQRVFVPSGKLLLADAALAAAGLSNPRDVEEAEPASSVFDVFSPPGTIERESQERLHRSIERALVTISGIEDATVISSRSRPSRWGQQPEVAAAVYVTPSPGSRFSAELRASIFTSVARMVPGLAPEQIVVIDQTSGRSWTPDSKTPVTQHELYEDQIAAALAWIPDVEVRVHGSPETGRPVPAQPRKPVEARSTPNQPGTTTPKLNSSQNGQSIEVEVLVPGPFLAEAAPSEQSTEAALAAVTRQIVSAVKRALPGDMAATVLVNRKPERLAAMRPQVAEQSESDLPLLPALLLVVLGASASVWWLVRKRATGQTGEFIKSAIDAAAVELGVARELSSNPDEMSLATDADSGMAPDSPPDAVLVSAGPATPMAAPRHRRFEYLQRMGPGDLYRLLAGEHPQTMALVLRHLPTGRATDVVSLLPSGIQSEVIRRISEADLSDAEVVDELEETLRTRTSRQPAVKAVDSTTDVISTGPASLLSPLQRFEEIVQLSPANLKRVADEVEESLWAEALHGSSETLRFRIIASLPPRQARAVRARLNAAAPPAASVETTRDRIVETVNALRLPDNACPLRHEFVA